MSRKKPTFDSELLKLARLITANASRSTGKMRQRYISGQCDNQFAVKKTLEALRHGIEIGREMERTIGVRL